MAETPSALRPRPGWDRAAKNPEASGIKIPVIAPSTGYTSTSYHPARGQPLTIITSGMIDQSEFAEEQQGHRLSRLSQTASPPQQPDTRSARGSNGLETAISVSEVALPPTNGRPAWDSRFHTNHTAWETEPRTLILRPPSSNPFPGSDSSLRRSCPQGTSTTSSDMKSPRARRASAFDGTDGGGAVDGYGGRTTVLPGLYATSPPLRQSPYFAASGASASLSTPNASVGGAQEPTLAPPIRPPRADIATSYVGQAYGPEQSLYRSTRRSCGGYTSFDGSGVQPAGAGASSEKGPEAEGDGGVDGRGTHLPALDRAYLQKPAPNVSEGRSEGVAGSAVVGSDASLGPDGKRKGAAGARAKQGTKSPKSPTSVYLPKAAAFPEPRAPSPGALQRLSQPRIFSTPLEFTGASSGPSPYAASEVRYQASLSKSMLNRSVGGGGIHLDHDGSALAGSWRPSGSQRIPDAPPPVPLTRRSQTSTGVGESQEEADRRRAVPRDTAIYSPERYPIVGQGWFLVPEKFPPNPTYADVKPRYMEVHTLEKPTLHIPDIHLKPWLTAGKHLLSDSSTPPPKVTGPAGARPPYSLSPAATGTTGGTLRSTGRGTGRLNGRAGGGRGRRTSSSGSEEEATGEQPEGELVAVIRGVRLMSIIKRGKMADEARLQAEEDAEFAAQDEQEGAQRRDSINDPSSEAHDEAGATSARREKSSDGEEQQQEQLAGNTETQKVARTDSDSQAGQARRFSREGSSSADRASGVEGDVDRADEGAAEEDAEGLGPGGAGGSGGSENGGLERRGSAASGGSRPGSAEGGYGEDAAGKDGGALSRGGGGAASDTDGAPGDWEGEEEGGEEEEGAPQQGDGGEEGEEEGYADGGGEEEEEEEEEAQSNGYAEEEEEEEEGLGDLQYQANALASDGEGGEEEEDVAAAAKGFGEGVADEDDE